MYACMFQNMGDFYKSGDHSGENGYFFWYFLARPRRMSQQQLIYNAMPAESKLSSAHVYTIPVSCRLCKCVMSCSFIQNKGFSWYLRTRTTPRDWMTAERTSDLNSNFHAPPFEACSCPCYCSPLLSHPWVSSFWLIPWFQLKSAKKL